MEQITKPITVVKQEFIEKMVNEVDQAFLLAIFEGIRGEGFSELANLKISDLVKEEEVCFINLKDDSKTETRKAKISKELYNLLYAANAQQDYLTPGTLRKNPFQESEYIFKKVRKGNHSGSTKIDTGHALRKLLMFKKVFEDAHLRYESIVQSGMMCMAYQIYKEKGTIAREDIVKISEQYGQPKAINISTLKEKIFHESMTDLYPDFDFTADKVK